jgi:hypothetical protein
MREIDLMCTHYVLLILFQEVLVHYRSIVASIGLGRKYEPITRVLRECAHESLQCLPEVVGHIERCVRRERDIRQGVCSARRSDRLVVAILGIIRTSIVWECDHVVSRRVDRKVLGSQIRWDCLAVAEACSRGLVNEEHVRRLRWKKNQSFCTDQSLWEANT